MRLIDVDALDVIGYCGIPKGRKDTFDDGVMWLAEQIDSIPTIDAVPVVRCRECRLHDMCATEDVFRFADLSEETRFCGVGKRREEEGEM